MTSATNNFTITGNISQPLQIRETKNGKKYMFISIAVNSGIKDKVDFISFIVWDKLAENVLKYCNKGDGISAPGFISIVKKDGNDLIQLTAESVSFLHKAAKKEEAPKPVEPEKDTFEPVTNDPFVGL